jgi:hypothetical protein
MADGPGSRISVRALKNRWGDAQPAAELITAIAQGAADELTGRVINPSDDLDSLIAACRSDPDLCRLRLNLR